MIKRSMFLVVASAFQISAAERGGLPSREDLKGVTVDDRKVILDGMVEKLNQEQKKRFEKIIIVSEFLKNTLSKSTTFEVEYDAERRHIVWWVDGRSIETLSVRFLADEEIAVVRKALFQYVSDETNASKRELRSLVCLGRGEALTREVLSDKLCELFRSAGLMR